MEQNEFDIPNNDNVKTKNNKKRKIALIIGISLIAFALLASLVGSLIAYIDEVNEGLDYAMSTIAFTEENMPDTLWERWELYKEFASDQTPDYDKYMEPIFNKAQESVADGCKNYHTSVLASSWLDDTTTLRVSAEIDVDDSVAHGTIDIELSAKPSEDLPWEQYYHNEVEFYRILENDQIKTYMSSDGENWLVKDGFLFNEGVVLFNIKQIVNNMVALDTCDYPMVLYNDVESYDTIVSSWVKQPTYKTPIMQEDFLYDKQGWNTTMFCLFKDSYLLQGINPGSYDVDKDRLKQVFLSTNDSILAKMCECELDLWPTYKFEKYGEVQVDLPENLSNAKEAHSFDELFVDLNNAIDQYVLAKK